MNRERWVYWNGHWFHFTADGEVKAVDEASVPEYVREKGHRDPGTY